MSPRSLFIVILRVFGILVLGLLVTQVTQILTTVFFVFDMTGTSGALSMFFFDLVGAIISLWMGYWLLFKPGELVSKFNLDKGFQETSFNLDISPSILLQIVLVVTGGVILFIQVPELIRLIYRIIEADKYEYDFNGPDWSPVIVSAFRIAVALLLIGERQRIIERLLNKQAEVPSPEIKSDIE